MNEPFWKYDHWHPIMNTITGQLAPAFPSKKAAEALAREHKTTWGGYVWTPKTGGLCACTKRKALAHKEEWTMAREGGEPMNEAFVPGWYTWRESETSDHLVAHLFTLDNPASSLLRTDCGMVVRWVEQAKPATTHRHCKQCELIRAKVVCLQEVAEFKVGDPPPRDYVAWHVWAGVQYRGGLRQVQDPNGLWKFPQELSK